MIAALVATVLLGGIAMRLLVTGAIHGGLRGAHRPTLRDVRRPAHASAIWTVSLVWIAAIAVLAAIAIAR